MLFSIINMVVLYGTMLVVEGWKNIEIEILQLILRVIDDNTKGKWVSKALIQYYDGYKIDSIINRDGIA